MAVPRTKLEVERPNVSHSSFAYCYTQLRLCCFQRGQQIQMKRVFIEVLGEEGRSAVSLIIGLVRDLATSS